MEPGRGRTGIYFGNVRNRRILLSRVILDRRFKNRSGRRHERHEMTLAFLESGANVVVAIPKKRPVEMRKS